MARVKGRVRDRFRVTVTVKVTVKFTGMGTVEDTFVFKVTVKVTLMVSVMVTVMVMVTGTVTVGSQHHYQAFPVASSVPAASSRRRHPPDRPLIQVDHNDLPGAQKRPGISDCYNYITSKIAATTGC